MQGVVVALVFFILLGQCYADLPVHCTHKQVLGKWKFSMGRGNSHSDQLFQRGCSKVNDVKNYYAKSNNFGLGEPSFKPVKQIEVLLEMPNKATATDKNGKQYTGTWTMVYDEGFEVRVAGRTFYANHKFTKGTDDHEYSHCGETYPGIFHPTMELDQPKWGCYYAVKTTKVPVVKFRKFGKQSRPISSVDKEAMVQYINSQKDTWNARHYPNIDFSRMGTPLRHYKLKPEDRADHQKWASMVEIKVDDIAPEFDWTKAKTKHGVRDYVGPAGSQGDCGSCYAYAVAEMFSSRMNILKDRPYQKSSQFLQSPQTILSCSPYSQGCQGGYPFLASKHIKDFGSYTDKVVPYYGYDQSCSKTLSKSSIKKMSTRAEDYMYIGGYYGGSSEKAMLRELYDHGPITVGFEVNPEFQSYSGGVFHSRIKYPEKDEFERVNHAVLITGFGEENGKKYWRVKNSWGPEWGEDGFFRIERGTDNLNIEHMTVAAYPSLGRHMPTRGKYMQRSSPSVGAQLMQAAQEAQQDEELEEVPENPDAKVSEFWS